MFLTETLGTAFAKVPMDIVGLLPATKKSNEYIWTIQNNFTNKS